MSVLKSAFDLEGGLPINRRRVSRTRRTAMGIRVTVREGERITEALRRLKKLSWRVQGAERKRVMRHTEPSLYRHLQDLRKRGKAKYAAYMKRLELGTQKR